MPRKPPIPPLRPEHPSRDSTADADSWATHDPGYSPDRFYTRATNDRDHGEYRRIKLAPEVIAEIERIVESRAVPEYQSLPDLVRDAVVHRIRWLNEHRRIPLSPTGKMMLLRAELARLEQRVQTRSAILQDLQRVAGAPGLQSADHDALVDTVRSRLEDLDPEDREAILQDMRRSAPVYVQQIMERALQAMRGEE